MAHAETLLELVKRTCDYVIEFPKLSQAVELDRFIETSRTIEAENLI